MNRAETLSELQNPGFKCDVLVIGGGAAGLGAAWDAATRGYRTVLVEARDFAQGTSSRSTKLIHGGVRYLAQLNLSLVRESLAERRRLFQNAPDLLQWREFVIPTGSWWDKVYYGAGLKAYDALAGGNGRASRLLNRDEVFERLPSIDKKRVRGGVSYWDGQFDDARLAVALALQIHETGGFAINHSRCESFIVVNGCIQGARVVDAVSEKQIELSAKVVINATGVASDAIRRKDDSSAAPLVAASRGSHIVLPVTRLGGDAAMMIPKTSDGRVLFAIPWREHLLVGTTDVATEDTSSEPRPTDEEIEFLLSHVNEHLTMSSSREDILSTFAGLRPLVRQPKARSTASMSRDHFIEVSAQGLVTIVGGKWTTFRKMAEDVVDRAVAAAGLPERVCSTQTQKIPSPFPPPSDALIDVRLPLTASQVRNAVRDQMAVKLEDVLARRSRCLFLDARATLEISLPVAQIMAAEQGHGEEWVRQEVTEFNQLASNYLPLNA